MKPCCEQHKQENKKSSGGAIVLFIGIFLIIAAIFVVYAGNAKQPSGASANDATKLIGKPVPEFSLADDKGNTYTSENLRGKDFILFFNEGLMCYPACWDQVAAFPQDKRFSDKNVMVFSVVTDTPESWQPAKEKMPALAAANVLFDVGASVSNSFGVLNLPSSMHRGMMPGHTYVVVDKQGIVKDVIDDPTMAINNDKLIQLF